MAAITRVRGEVTRIVELGDSRLVQVSDGRRWGVWANEGDDLLAAVEDGRVRVGCYLEVAGRLDVRVNRQDGRTFVNTNINPDSFRVFELEVVSE